MLEVMLNIPVDDLGNSSVGVEALEPARSTNSALLLKNLSHLVQIVLDDVVARVVLESSESGHGGARILPAALGGQPTGGLGDGEDTEAQGNTEEDTEANDDAPGCAVVLNLADAKVDDVGDENADCDHQLVRGDNGTTDFCEIG